ncbi:hypothetical protein [Bacillus velezensis]|uniref:hypothetical protein n=1 Tax=Bacillus velezensis TaxID=492670 RepID=UPI0039B077F1
MYKIIDISGYFNNIGATNIHNFNIGNLSLGSSSFPEEEIPFNKDFKYEKIPFIFKKKNNFDNIQLEGQYIKLKEAINCEEIFFVGVASNGDMSGQIDFLLDDKLITTTKIRLTDFTSDKPAFLEKVVLTFNYIYSKSGINNMRSNMWVTKQTFNSLTFNKLKFEYNPFIHIFCITCNVKNGGI